MAKSLSSIMSQIERLQKEAAAIQSEVIARVRKDIAKYGLTAEQLFGLAPTAKSGRAKKAPTKSTQATRQPKYADGTGNTWGGMGKRPAWLKEALAAGKLLEEFLIGKAAAPTTTKAALTTTRAKRKPARELKAPAKKRAAVKTAAPRKPRTKAPTVAHAD